MIADSDPRVPWSARLPIHDQRRWARYRAHLAEAEASRWVPIPRHPELAVHRSHRARRAYEAALALDAGVPKSVLEARVRVLLMGE